MQETTHDDTDHFPFWVRTKDGLAFGDMEASAGGRAPDFCIIGAAKSASSSINTMLSEHPGLFLNPLKEPHYYSTDAFYGKKKDWYFGLYADAKPGQLLGEASTSYSRYPVIGVDVPKRMAEDNPDMKIILIVREPVSRLKSECLQEIKYRTFVLGEHLDVPSLDDFLERTEASPTESTGKIQAGEYMVQVDRYLEHFPKENIKVVFYDDFRADHESFMKEIVGFIGADPMPDFGMVQENVTSGIVETTIAVNAIGKMDRIPFVKTLRRLIPKSIRQSIRARLFKNKAQNYEFSARKLDELSAHYAPHNEKLRRYTHRDLAKWS